MLVKTSDYCLCFVAGSDTSSDSAVEEEAATEGSISKGIYITLASKVSAGVCFLVASDEELSDPGNALQVPASAQNFEIPLCSVCLEDSYGLWWHVCDR